MIPILIWMITNSDKVHHQQTRDYDSSNKDQGRDEDDLSGFSLALHVLLPVAGLALIFSRKDIFSKILQQLDRSCVSVFCPSLSRREKLLKWASGRLPTRWSSQSRTLSSGISELWRDGSLLCTLINSAVPGACSNPHRHWKKPPSHAQALAYKYFGLTPHFTDQELSSDFCMNHERNFVRYLQDLQQAMSRWPTRDENNKNIKYTSQYLARGMGLYTGEENKKAVFYIYSNNSSSKRRGDDIFMFIKGPYGAEGRTTIPPHSDLKTNPFQGVLQNHLRSLKKTNKTHLLKTISLDLTSLVQGTTCSDQKKDEIPIQIDTESDRVKVTYIPKSRGMYEINLISNGEILKGSPYDVRILENLSGRKDSFTETFQKTKQKVIATTKRKIISKIIDCIDEKICISNCGRVSTISNKDDDEDVIVKNEDVLLRTEMSYLSDKSAKIDTFHAITKISEELESALEVAEAIQVDAKCKEVNNSDVEIVKSLQEPPVIKKNNEEESPSGNKVDFIKNFVPSKLINAANNESHANNNNNPQKQIFVEIGPHQVESYPPTSPICPDHIDPEVPYCQLPPSAKRKIFGSQKNSSFSSVEIDEVSAGRTESSSPTAMSVLNVLDTLRKTNNNNVLKSAKSLPNFGELNNNASLVRIRRKYWEEMTSTSSSTTSLSLLPPSDLGEGHGKKFPINSKNIFNGSSVFNRDKLKKYQENEDLTKSADNIFAMKSEYNYGSSRKYRSFDESIENCSVISIEERKRILLKDRYEKELASPRQIQKILNNRTNNNNRTPERSLDITSTVAERIKKFDECKSKGAKLKTINISQSEKKSVGKSEELEKNKHKLNLRAFKSSFKKAIKFFKNLEESTPEKAKIKDPGKRRHSLSLNSVRRKPVILRKGGSLPNTYQRFSISNLYSDVFGSINGSFKGVPNQIGMTSSLTSFFENSTNEEADEPKEAIKYSLFISKSKTKKRKSLKTLFDVNY